MWHRTAFLLFCLAGLPSPAAAQATPPVELAPHRAVYRFAVDPQARLAEGLAIDGELVVELSDHCDEWRTPFEFVGALKATGLEQRFAVRTTLWESRDGTRLRFASLAQSDDGLEERAAGEAEVSAGGGSASFEGDREAVIALPADTLLPTAALQGSLQRLLAGETHVAFTTFNADAETPLVVSTWVVEAAVAAGTAPAIESPLLAAIPSWRVTSADYPVGGKDGQPDGALSGRLYANGIFEVETIALQGLPPLRAQIVTLEPRPRACD